MLAPPYELALVLPINSYPWPDSSPPTQQDKAGCDGCDINGKWSQGDTTPQSNSGICHCPGHADWASLAHWLRLMMTVAPSLSPCVASPSIAVSKHDPSHINPTHVTRDTTCNCARIAFLHINCGWMVKGRCWSQWIEWEISNFSLTITP